MATASDFITRAHTRLGIREAETSLTAGEMADGLDLLNDMMAELEPILKLGMSPVAIASDEIRIPRYANGGLIDLFAVRLAPEYSRPISPALAASANSAIKNILNIKVFIPNVDFPSTLPVGSGSDYDDYYYNDRFFPEQNKSNF